MIVIQRRFSNVTVWETETSQTLEASGGTGGGNVPIVLIIKDESEENSKSDSGHPGIR